MNILRKSSAAMLSGDWDSLATSYFQKKKFLLYSEAHNPCRQRYYELWDGGRLASGACVYTLWLDLLTFARIKSPVRFAIVGVPAFWRWRRPSSSPSGRMRRSSSACRR